MKHALIISSVLSIFVFNFFNLAKNSLKKKEIEFYFFKNIDGFKSDSSRY